MCDRNFSVRKFSGVLHALLPNFWSKWYKGIEGLKWEKGFDTLIFDVEDLTKKITNILKKD